MKERKIERGKGREKLEADKGNVKGGGGGEKGGRYTERVEGGEKEMRRGEEG